MSDMTFSSPDASGGTMDTAVVSSASEATMTVDHGGVSDAEFNDAWSVIRGQGQSAPAAAADPAASETPAEGAQDANTPNPPAEQANGQQPAEAQNPPGWNPDGPGDPRAALHQTRQELANIKRERDELRAAQEKIATESKKQERDERYQELLAEDPQAAADFLLGEAEADRDAERAQAEAERRAERRDMSIQFAVSTLPGGEAAWSAALEHVEAIENAMAAHLPDGASFINWDAIDGGSNPAQAVLALRGLLVDAQANEAEVERRSTEKAQALFAQLQAASNPQSPRAPRGIDAIPSAAPAAGTQIRDASEANTDAMSDSEFQAWKNAVLYSSRG